MRAMEIEDVYRFPDAGIDSLAPVEDRILGIQAWRWTETTVTQDRRAFLTFPRLIALSEPAWTILENKDPVDFQDRLKKELPRLKQLGIGFYDPFRNRPKVVR